MAAQRMIVRSQGSKGTEPMRQVVVICMIQGDSSGPTVKARGGENTVGEVVLKVDVFTEERL